MIEQINLTEISDPAPIWHSSLFVFLLNSCQDQSDWQQTLLFPQLSTA